MNLHLIHNDKFFSPAFNAFEKYYFNDNLYISLTSIHHAKVNSIEHNILYVSLSTFKGVKLVKHFLRNKTVKNIFVHNADNLKINLGLDFKERYSANIYWIFFGADLYSRLIKENKYYAFDVVPSGIPTRPTLIQYLKNKYHVLCYLSLFKKFPSHNFKNFCRQVDYFCFWNENDYKLLVDNYFTNATYKSFLYFDLLPEKLADDIKYVKNKILVNHNASVYGNHLTILKKLSQIETVDPIICPLSYGSSVVKKNVKNEAKYLFDNNLTILSNFMNKDDYYKILFEVKVAIFGHRRQEAGANIFAMILFGAKVFLRNDNNVLKWLKDRGFVCFSFEDDLNSPKDLEPLCEESINLNKSLYTKYFSKEAESEIFKNLIEK